MEKRQEVWREETVQVTWTGFTGRMNEGLKKRTLYSQLARSLSLSLTYTHAYTCVPTQQLDNSDLLLSKSPTPSGPASLQHRLACSLFVSRLRACQCLAQKCMSREKQMKARFLDTTTPIPPHPTVPARQFREWHFILRLDFFAMIFY